MPQRRSGTAGLIGEDIANITEKYFGKPAREEKELAKSKKFETILEEIYETEIDTSEVEAEFKGYEWMTEDPELMGDYEVFDEFLAPDPEEELFMTEDEKETDRIRKARKMLELIDIHGAYTEAGQPKGSRELLRQLSKIISKPEVSPEQKMLQEQERQRLRYGPESAREGFEERRAGVRETAAEKKFKQTLTRDQLQHYYAMKRMGRREKQHAAKAAQSQDLAIAKLDATQKLKFDVKQGRQNPESARGIMDMDLKDVENEIKDIRDLLDTGELFGGLEDSYEKALKELQKTRSGIIDARRWVATETGKIKPEAETTAEEQIKGMTQQQRKAAAAKGRRMLQSNPNHPNKSEIEEYIRLLESY
jgi:hypothetical protein